MFGNTEKKAKIYFETLLNPNLSVIANTIPQAEPDVAFTLNPF
jgi:hypothetical protein